MNLVSGNSVGPTNPVSGGWGGNLGQSLRRVDVQEIWVKMLIVCKNNKSSLITFVFNVFLAEHFLCDDYSLEGLFLTKNSLCNNCFCTN